MLSPKLLLALHRSHPLAHLVQVMPHLPPFFSPFVVEAPLPSVPYWFSSFLSCEYPLLVLLVVLPLAQKMRLHLVPLLVVLLLLSFRRLRLHPCPGLRQPPSSPPQCQIRFATEGRGAS